jgi:hypothetical protein
VHIRAVPLFATVRRRGDTVTLKAKLQDVDPTTVHATVVDDDLVVTAHVTPPTGTGTATVGSAPARHRLVDLGRACNPCRGRVPRPPDSPRTQVTVGHVPKRRFARLRRLG